MKSTFSIDEALFHSRQIYPVMRGEKVALARFRPSDAEALARGMANLHTTLHLGLAGAAPSLPEEEKFLEKVLQPLGTEITFGIYEAKDARLLGGVTLRKINHQHNTAELGVCINATADQGRGYGSEAVRLMVEYGFYFLSLHNIVLSVYSFNARAKAAYEKAGFYEIGRRRGAFKVAGERHDVITMEMLASDADLGRMREIGGV